LAELVRICENETLPLIVGGDFNIIRRKEEKNNDNFYARWPFIFNAIIESLDLREIVLSGRQFTWANMHTIPTYEKLDHILVRVEVEQKFPLLSVRALTRSGLITRLYFWTLEVRRTVKIPPSLSNFHGSDKMVSLTW
jgi:hypothetical protein